MFLVCIPRSSSTRQFYDEYKVRKYGMSPAMRKVLVVGGNGFVGLSSLLQVIHSQCAHRINHRVFRLGSLSSGPASRLPCYQHQVSVNTFRPSCASVKLTRRVSQLVRTPVPDTEGPYANLDRKGGIYESLLPLRNSHWADSHLGRVAEGRRTAPRDLFTSTPGRVGGCAYPWYTLARHQI